MSNTPLPERRWSNRFLFANTSENASSLEGHTDGLDENMTGEEIQLLIEKNLEQSDLSSTSSQAAAS
jgi:hypothetical protein